MVPHCFCYLRLVVFDTCLSCLVASRLFSYLLIAHLSCLISCSLCVLRHISSRRMSSHLFLSLFISWIFFLLIGTFPESSPFYWCHHSHTPRSFFILDILPIWFHDSSRPSQRVVPFRSFSILDILPIWCHDSSPSNQNCRTLFCHDSSPPNLMGRIPFIKDLRGTGDAFLGAQMIRNQVNV